MVKNSSILSEDTFFDFAVSAYINKKHLGIKEFREDLKLIKYIKRLFRRFRNPECAKSLRLALNHIVIFYNVFEREAATRILFFKLEPELHNLLATFLTHLSLLPAIVHNIEGTDIYTKDLVIDSDILEELRTL